MSWFSRFRPGDRVVVTSLDFGTGRHGTVVRIHPWRIGPRVVVSLDPLLGRIQYSWDQTCDFWPSELKKEQS